VQPPHRERARGRGAGARVADAACRRTPATGNSLFGNDAGQRAAIGELRRGVKPYSPTVEVSSAGTASHACSGRVMHPQTPATPPGVRFLIPTTADADARRPRPEVSGKEFENKPERHREAGSRGKRSGTWAKVFNAWSMAWGSKAKRRPQPHQLSHHSSILATPTWPYLSEAAEERNRRAEGNQEEKKARIKPTHRDLADGPRRPQ
jgi:hypothetical protein